jgi:hypothetical protein
MKYFHSLKVVLHLQVEHSNYLDDKGKKMHLQYVFKDGTLVSMAEQNGYFKK